MNKLNIFFEEKHIGVLIRDDELVYSFCYTDTWLKDNNAFELSLAMPLREEPYGNKITLSFFENLLPEGDARIALEKGQGINSIYDFLKNFGEDSAGAVIVTDKKKSPFNKNQKSKEVKIEMSDIYNAIDEKRSVAEVVADMNPGYLSLAGAQDKFPVLFKDGEFYLPTDGRPTTHIVKTPIYRSGVQESVYNEYYCMKLAARVGFNIPHVEVLDHKTHPLYIIERYDRKIGKEIERIHQQDFCQAQGIVSENKYEASGGPSLLDNYLLIKSNVTISKRTKALFSYLDWIAFNLLIGNNDSHSKNISFVLKNRKIELAPFYDLLSTAIYPKLKKRFSYQIGDRDDASRIGKNQFEMVDEELGLKLGTMSSRVSLMSEKLLKHKDELVLETKEKLPSAKIPRRISNLIEDRCKSLRRQGL